MLHHLTPELVGQCLARIPLKSAPGVDGMTAKQALDNVDWLLPSQLDAIHKGKYEAPPVRRVLIPKSNGGQRPIGVPQVIDRAIQAGMAKILNEIYEQDFLPCSFGFRPKIGCHHALATINELQYKWKLNYALEVDIRDFFGSLKHDADDFLILCKNKEDMESVKTLLIARFAQFGLSLAEEKTHTTDLTPRSNSGKDRRRISFLGFNILRVPNRNGTGIKTVFQTEGKRFTRAKAQMKEKMFKMMHVDVGTQAKVLNSTLIGHLNYYGIAGNLKHIQNFWDFTKRYWRRCLSRRSQNGAVNWEKMDELLKKYPLISPRIKIPYQAMNQYVRL